MAAIGPIAFAVLLWGAVLSVAAVFGYVAYAVGIEYGWITRLGPGCGSGNGGESG
jgi:hypothetical protein